MTMAELIDLWRLAEVEAERANDRATSLRCRLRLALARTGPVCSEPDGPRVAFDGEEIVWGGESAGYPLAKDVEEPGEAFVAPAWATASDGRYRWGGRRSPGP